jgi:hypothetical protein
MAPASSKPCASPPGWRIEASRTRSDDAADAIAGWHAAPATHEIIQEAMETDHRPAGPGGAGAGGTEPAHDRVAGAGGGTSARHGLGGCGAVCAGLFPCRTVLHPLHASHPGGRIHLQHHSRRDRGTCRRSVLGSRRLCHRPDHGGVGGRPHGCEKASASISSTTPSQRKAGRSSAFSACTPSPSASATISTA